MNVDHLRRLLEGVQRGKVKVERACQYSCEDADLTLLLANMLLPKIEADGFGDLYRVPDMCRNELTNYDVLLQTDKPVYLTVDCGFGEHPGCLLE
jgi:hypothetical protein